MSNDNVLELAGRGNNPTPTDYLQVRKVRLPHLIDGRGLVLALTGCLYAPSRPPRQEILL